MAATTINNLRTRLEGSWIMNLKRGLSRAAWGIILTTTWAGCSATDEGNPNPPAPDGGVMAPDAAAPIECTEATPICNPACGANETCTYQAGACACERVCIPEAPSCAGGGPNNGCAAGQFCDTSCTCQAEVTCDPAQPTCPGNGPNAGCDLGFECDASCACVRSAARPALTRASRSTPIDVTIDDSLVAMVNTDDGTVSFFNVQPGAESRSSRLASSGRVGASEPVSVVIHPNGTEAFVANRATGTVSRIVRIDTTTPALDGEVEIGAEPIGIALSPLGTEAWVTDWVNGNVVVIDTATMQIDRTIAAGGNPFALVITSDGDEDESDETVLVTQFYGRDRAPLLVTEGVDDGKNGIVQVIPIAGNAVAKEIELSPIGECFTAPVGNPPADLTSGCFFNQLLGITVHTAFGKSRAYVVAVGASPEGPVNFNHNVQALVGVIDLATQAEDVALTANLNRLIREQQVDNDGDESIGRRFLNVPNAIDFVPRDNAAIGYVTSAGSDVVLRLEYAEDGSLTVGSPQSFNIPVGQNPQGLVVKHSSTNGGAFTANLISRDVSIVSFRDQLESKKVTSTDAPTNPQSAEFKVWKGKRFFNTSTGIWGREGWGSCQGCHPMGLTDNVTWKFAAGPRQTISMDGQYASEDPADMRALNWTAIFDETHDFENNTRGVSGGKGAIQNDAGAITSPSGPAFSSILVEDGTNRENHQALNGSLRFITGTEAICTNEATCPDWDLVDEYVKTIRSPRGKTATASQLTDGRVLFEDGGCNKCHAGPKWTVSRTFYRPEVSSGAPPMRTFEANRAATVAMDPASLRTLPRDVNTDTTLIAGDDSDGGTPALKRQACNIRSVGTFGAEGGGDETRDNGSPAQGRKGYNPPSLLGLATGAPYLHNGAASELASLFEARFDGHTKAGNPNFNPTADEREALISFLLSIDESTAVFPIDPDTLLCPTSFTP